MCAYVGVCVHVLYTCICIHVCVGACSTLGKADFLFGKKSFKYKSSIIGDVDSYKVVLEALFTIFQICKHLIYA